MLRTAAKLLGGTKVIFVEYDVPVRPFSTAVLACLPPEAGRYDTIVTWTLGSENLEMSGIPFHSMKLPVGTICVLLAAGFAQSTHLVVKTLMMHCTAFSLTTETMRLAI